MCETFHLVFLLQDPFLRVSRMVESGGTIPICKTEVIDNNLNPKWKPVCLNFQQFGSKVSLPSLDTSLMFHHIHID
jgi:hypothetical protein